MGAHSRTKGIRYEREVCNEISALLDVERFDRKLGQERDGGNDIDLKLLEGGWLRLECKRRAKIGQVRDWWEEVDTLIRMEIETTGLSQGDRAAVVMRADGWNSSLVVLELKDFLALVRAGLAPTQT